MHEALRLLFETYSIEDFVKRAARFNAKLFSEGGERPKMSSTLTGKEGDQAVYEWELEYAQATHLVIQEGSSGAAG